MTRRLRSLSSQQQLENLSEAYGTAMSRIEREEARADKAEAGNARLAQQLAQRSDQLCAAVEIIQSLANVKLIDGSTGQPPMIPFTLVAALVRRPVKD